MPKICFGSNITISCVLFVTSNDVLFLMNFNFNNTVHCSLLSYIFTMVRPEISSTNGASIFMNFLSFGFNTTCSFEKNGIDLFRNLNYESCVSIAPSNSNTFLMPNTKSTLTCISDTSMNISNLCPYTSIITGITNNMLHIVHCLPELFTLLKQILVMHEVIYIACNRILTYMTYWHLYLSVCYILYCLITSHMYTLVQKLGIFLLL